MGRTGGSDSRNGVLSEGCVARGRQMLRAKEESGNTPGARSIHQQAQVSTTTKVAQVLVVKILGLSDSSKCHQLYSKQ